jgi:hypothetical protein
MGWMFDGYKKGNNQARIGILGECFIAIIPWAYPSLVIPLFVSSKHSSHRPIVAWLVPLFVAINQTRIGLWDECLMATKRGIAKLG